MNILQTIKGRRSIRSFRNKEISDRIVRTLINAARWAPSAGNTQPWEFIVVKKPETKRRLVQAALDQTFIKEAPVVIVVCANEQRSSRVYRIRGKTLYCIQDTAAAIQNILLTAHSLGLGTCWVGAFNEDEARGILKVPDGVRPIAIIPLGYAAETPEPPSRRSVGQVVHKEVY